MRAQHMPKPVNHPRPVGMAARPMRVPVDMTGRDRSRIAHNAQDAGKTGLPHIDNNHPDATAKHPQTPCPPPPMTKWAIRGDAFRYTFYPLGPISHQHGRVGGT